MTSDATILETHLNRQAERSERFFWNRLRWNLISERLVDETAPFEVVDVGAGPGFLGDFLARTHPAAKYRFIEPLAGLEDGLETRFGADSNYRDRISFGAVGYVTLLDVLEHQEDDRAFMAELSDKLSPGTLLLLTVPAMPSLWSQWDVALGHYRRYRKDSLRHAIRGLPFEIEEMSYLFPELLPLGWFRKLRLGRRQPSEEEAGAEFPDLPGWLNESLFRIGSLTMRHRGRAPAGTSLFAALRHQA